MEVKMEDLDRIVISSNKQMQKIIDWFDLNKEYIIEITDNVMTLPIKDGVIRFEEEGIDFEFHVHSSWGKFAAHMKSDYTKEHVPVFQFEANLAPKEAALDYSKHIRNLKFFSQNTDNVKKLREIVKIDNTTGKLVFKWFCVMGFMLFNEEIVEVDHSQDKTRTRRVARAMGIRNQPLSLVRKTYVVKNFDPKKKIKGAPRGWTAPDHEVGVRGHYRHYKNGKVIWISEFSKFKEKGNRQPKTWEV